MSLVLLSGCITADGAIQRDGTATLTLSFPTAATVENDKAARALVSSAEVTIETLEIGPAASGERGPRRATAKLSAKRAGAFDTLPLLRVIGTTIVHEPKPDGGGSFRLQMKNARPQAKDDPQVANMMKFQASVRLRVPGPIIETSGTQKDGGVEWSFPAGDWSLGKNLELTISYGPPPDSDESAAAPKAG